MMFLLDTTICIFLIKQKSEVLLENIAQHPADGLGISSVTLAELDFGVEKSSRLEHNRRALDEFMGAFILCPFDEAAALHYGAVRAELERCGTPIDPLDLLIAAHALSIDATLITNNVKEFRKVERLRVADWTAARA